MVFSTTKGRNYHAGQGRLVRYGHSAPTINAHDGQDADTRTEGELMGATLRTAQVEKIRRFYTANQYDAIVAEAERNWQLYAQQVLENGKLQRELEAMARQLEANKQ